MTQELYQNCPVYYTSGFTYSHSGSPVLVTVRNATSFPPVISGISQAHVSFQDSSDDIGLVLNYSGTQDGGAVLSVLLGQENSQITDHADYCPFIVQVVTAQSLQNLVGGVNNQSGQSSYTFQGTDARQVVIFNNGSNPVSGLLPSPTSGDSSTFNPHYVVDILNLGTGSLTLTASGLINSAPFTVVAPNSFTKVWTTNSGWYCYPLINASGTIQSGNIASGAVQGYFGSTRNIASGTVGVTDFGSGAVVAGTVGSGAIVSGNIASGQIGRFHQASIVGSGNNVVFNDTPMILSPLLNPYADIANSGTPASPGSNPARLFGFTEVNRNRLGYVDASGFVERICQDQFIVCRNITGSTMTKGQVVYVSGSQGSQRPAIWLAQANSQSTMPATGVVAETIINNADGYMMFHGHLENLDTSAFSDGDELYVSPTVAGGLTNVKPAFPQIVATVIKAHLTQGILLVNPDGIPFLYSGQITSGFILGSGALWGSLGPTALIASGTIGTNDLGNASVLSGNIGSGQVGRFHLASGSIQSGTLVSGAVVSGNIASGQVDWWTFASGVVWGDNTVTVTQTGSGIKLTATGIAALASGSVQSGNIASGAVQGFFGSTRNIASGTVGVWDLGSGAVIAGTVGSGAIQSGNIASGSIGISHLQSGLVTSGLYLSGSIGSGQIGTIHLASGTAVAFASGVQTTATAATNIAVGSGGLSGYALAVGYVVSGGNYVIPTDPTQSGWPAIGVVSPNAVVVGPGSNSGASVTVTMYGNVTAPQFNFSGLVGLPVWATNSGVITTTYPGGAVAQQIGVVTSYSGIFVNPHTVLASGIIRSGMIGSGQVGNSQLASGAVLSGHLSSGAVYLSGGAGITLTQSSPNSWTITNASGGPLASGVIQSGMIGNNAVNSGNISSGAVGPYQLSTNAVQSGNIASGAILIQSGAGINVSVTNNNIWTLTNTSGGPLASGVVQSGMIGNAAVVSGSIGSGQIAAAHIQSGTLIAGPGINVTFGLSGITLANASGAGGTGGGGIASGVAVFFSGVGPITQEIISGVRAVSLSLSGYLQVAMASITSRMPAMGIVVDNVLSGIQVNVYSMGQFQAGSGMVDYSGYLGGNLFVGRSGQVVTSSGSWNSGGFFTTSGDQIQPIGTVGQNSGSIIFEIGDALVPNQVVSGNISSGSIWNTTMGFQILSQMWFFM